MIRADLHVHTCHSPDASNQPKQIVEQLNKHPTIKAVAITDHNSVEGYWKTAKLAEAYPDIMVIPGMEISAKEGEIILLGTTQLPPQPWTAQAIIDHAKGNNALTVAPHPYRGYGLHDLAKELSLDAIETLNGITSPSQNKKAEQLAKTKDIAGVAGSDTHFPSDMWTVYTEIQASLCIDEILNAIRKSLVKTAKTERSIHF
jgi:predicted metal-dependent phosphoesterase TrpH